MIRTHTKTKSTHRPAKFEEQINESALVERWGREDLWADVAGEEIDEISFTLDAYDDLPATRHAFND